MPGSYAANLKEGSRSEILADYLFSRWGAVTPVRRQDDVGVDLYCTLSDRLGRRTVVRDYFGVQVKSGTDPWVFKHQNSVKWLVEYPTPLFLACVDKEKGSVSVYHLTPRFYVWALGKLPPRLELRPSNTESGEFVSWENGENFSLSAPVIRATIADLTDGKTMGGLGRVFSCWVGFDRENLDLMRAGLLRFRMPHTYRTNQPPNTGIGEAGSRAPEPKFLKRGILRLAESAECIGGQLFHQGDRSGALQAALLVRYLLKNHKQVFMDQPRWTGSIPGDLGRVLRDLNEALGDRGGSRHVYSGIDEVGKALENDQVVKNFLTRR
jgi:Domain of unknown function (DUF4365)